jgi:hypothetical protein
MLRRASRQTPDVLLSILETVEEIGRAAYSDQYRAELGRHAALVKAESDASSSIARDKERVNRRYGDVVAGLGQQQSMTPANEGGRVTVETRPAQEG